MGTWESRGLRGSVLEDMINRTNALYREKELALIQKVPTPIKPINIDKSTRHITLAYFDEKSTVDYIGVAQGVPICFDAKECAKNTFPLQNIHGHQILFMKDFEEQDGIAFFLIHFTETDKFYYLRLSEAEYFWDRMEKGGRKSFTIEELDPKYFFDHLKNAYIPYLDMVNRDISERNLESD